MWLFINAINRAQRTISFKKIHLFSVTETKYDGSTTGRGAENADARAKRRDATANGSFVQRERASDARDRHTSWHDQGKWFIHFKKKQNKNEDFSTSNFAFPGAPKGNVINPSRSSSYAYRDTSDIIKKTKYQVDFIRS